MSENRDVIALQNEIANDAKEWDDHQRDASYLYTGARLANAREQLQAKRLVLSGLAQSFIEASVKAHADELEAARQRANQLRRRSLYLTAALAIALLAVGIAVFLSLQSRQQARVAFVRQLTAESIAQRSIDLALSFPLSVEAWKHAQDAGMEMEGTGTLLRAVTNSPKLVAFLNGQGGKVYSVAFSPDGKILASGAVDGTIILWDVLHERELTRFSQSGIVLSLAFSPDGRLLASASYDGAIVWDALSGKQLFTGPDQSVSSVAFSPDGQILASGGESGCTLLSVVERTPVGQLNSGPIESQAFNTDGSILATGGPVGNISLWDWKNEQQLGASFTEHNGHIYTLTFSPDGSILASGSWDKSIILWDVASKTPLGPPLIGHSKEVHSLTFSPDGKTLASIGLDESIFLWDVTSGRALGIPLTGHTDSINSLAFSSDGHTLAAGSSDTRISLWNLDRNQRLGEILSGHSNTVYSVAFSPDGKRLASSSWDKSILLWDVLARRVMGERIRLMY